MNPTHLNVLNIVFIFFILVLLFNFNLASFCLFVLLFVFFLGRLIC
jgi:hypothetical protein